MKLTTALTALFLLKISTTVVVDSFVPIPSIPSLQFKQQQQQQNGESLVVTYNSVGEEDGSEEESERKLNNQHQRFGMNVMGVLSGQFYANKVSKMTLIQLGGMILSWCSLIMCIWCEMVVK